MTNVLMIDDDDGYDGNGFLSLTFWPKLAVLRRFLICCNS